VRFDRDSQHRYQPHPANPSSPSAAVDDVADLFDNSHDHTLHYSSGDNDALSTAFFAPIHIADKLHLRAYIDTGASHSVLRRSLVDKLPEPVHDCHEPAPAGSQISLGAENVTVPRIGTIILHFPGAINISHIASSYWTPPPVSISSLAVISSPY
jgi:hypothetical protein